MHDPVGDVWFCEPPLGGRAISLFKLCTLEEGDGLIRPNLESVRGGSGAHGIHAVQQVDRHVPQRRQHLRRVPLADPAMILVERHIPHVVQRILNRPMGSNPRQHVEGRRSRRL